MRGLLSIRDLSKDDILALIERAEQFKKSPPNRLLSGFILANCFFEPSTRTRLSFDAAMKRLGGEVIGFSDPQATSMQKGESLSDAIQVIGGYADVLVIRHQEEGAAQRASLATHKPVINAGDGTNEHPTQSLIDLFSIMETQKRLEGLHIALVGDLLNGRTVHSLILALRHFKCHLSLVASKELSFPIDERGSQCSYSYHDSLHEVMRDADILYMTRTQKERFKTDADYEQVKDAHTITAECLKSGKKNLRVLHPLPRVSEICTSVDPLPHAYYFQQAENGLYLRQALLTWVLGK